MKGWRTGEIYGNGNRIARPLIKVNGTLKESSWEAALDFIAKKVSALTDKDRSVGVIGSAKITNEESFLLNKFARQVIKTNNIDSAFTLNYAPLFEKISELHFSLTMDDLEKSDLVIVIGSNIGVEAPQIARRVLRAVDKGAKLIIVNALRVPFCDMADLFVQTKPDGFNDLKDVKSFFNQAGNPVVIVGEDIFKGPNANDDFGAIFEAFKDKVFPIFNVNNILGALAHGVSPYIDASILEQKFKITSPKTKGLNLFEMRDAAATGSLKCLYVVGENILESMGDLNRTRAALERLEFLVVQDLFLTETAQLAHVVLPACSALEKRGHFINMEGKIQPVNPILSPYGESKPDGQIIMDLAKKMDCPLPYANVESISNEISDLHLLSDYRNMKIDLPVETVSSDYPLWLKVDSPRVFFHSGSLLKNSAILLREMEPSVVLMNSDYAKEKQFKGNDKVKLVSKSGALVRNVLISEEIPKNIVVLRTNLSDNSHTALLPVGLKWTVVKLEKLQ
jgi:predicted molibdopterin-dependent oxidoreductase YjgC